MTGGGHGDVGAEHGVIAHIDVGIVHQGQTEIGIDVAAEVDMMTAHVGVQGRLNVAALAQLREHLPQQLFPLAKLCGAGVVEIIEPIQPAQLILHDGRIVGEIDVSGVEQVTLIHRKTSCQGFLKSLYKNVTICARLHRAPGRKYPPSMPAVMPRSAAQSTAL